MNSKQDLRVGEMVRSRTGPFQAFTGRIDEVDEQLAILKVRVDIFGRPEPVELRFIDVDKISFTEEE